MIAPEMTGPETTGPDTTGPELTAPDATAHEVIAHEVIAHEVIAHEVIAHDEVEHSLTGSVPALRAAPSRRGADITLTSEHPMVRPYALTTRPTAASPVERTQGSAFVVPRDTHT